MVTLHQLHATTEDQANRLKFEGESLSPQLRDITGRLNEAVFSRDEAVARADSLTPALAHSEQIARAQSTILTLGREDVLRAKAHFANFFKRDKFMRTHGLSLDVDTFAVSF